MEEILQWKNRKKAPVCCHEGADFHNIGYTKATLTDGAPIEAELYRYDNNITLSVVMPEFDTKHEMRYKVREKHSDREVIPFSREVLGYDYSILDTGMVFDDQEEDINVICEYVEYLADMGVIRWLGDMRDGFVEYLIDVEGSYLACVKITVEENGQKFCEPVLKFHSF